MFKDKNLALGLQIASILFVALAFAYAKTFFGWICAAAWFFTWLNGVGYIGRKE